MTNLLVIDKDNTLVTSKFDVFVRSPHDQVPIDGMSDRLDELAEQGWLMAIASNQRGIEEGYKTRDEAIEEMVYCLGLFPQISFALFSPHFKAPDVECWQVNPDGSTDRWHDQELHCPPDWVSKHTPASRGCRKPNDGMIQVAYTIAHLRGLIIDQVHFVGDRHEDKGAADTFGCGFTWAEDFRQGWPPSTKPTKTAEQETPPFNLGDRIMPKWKAGAHRRGTVARCYRKGKGKSNAWWVEVDWGDGTGTLGNVRADQLNLAVKEGSNETSR